MRASAAETLKLQGNELEAHSFGMNTFVACFPHPDGNKFVSGSNKEIKVWDAGSLLARILGSWEEDKHVEEVSAMAFSEDGMTVASGDMFGETYLWDAGAAARVSRARLAARTDATASPRPQPRRRLKAARRFCLTRLGLSHFLLMAR